MKKITLLLLLVGLFFNLNAQQSQLLNKHAGEKISQEQTNYLMQLKSAKNIDLGWAWPSDDIYANLSSSTGATYYSNLLFPDSTVCSVTSGTAGIDYNWTMAIGQTFDPYSKVFDPALTTPLVPAGKSYIIDSIAVLGWYSKRNSSVDTLILEFTHNPGNASNNSFSRVYIVKTGTTDTLWFAAPKMHGDPAQFGYKAKLSDAGKTIVKHVLNLGDTTMASGKYIAFPVGLTIPAGQITAVSLAFVPGSTNAFGDTAYTYGAGAVQTSHINAFRFGWYSEDATTSNYIFYDITGLNLSYMITTGGRYVTYSGGSTGLMNNIMIPMYDGAMDIGWKVQEVVGVNELSNSDVKIFPNPSSGLVNIELLSNTPATANFYNLLGEVVKSVKLTNAKTTVDLSGNASGIYMMKIQQGNNVITKKIILK